MSLSGMNYGSTPRREFPLEEEFSTNEGDTFVLRARILYEDGAYNVVDYDLVDGSYDISAKPDIELYINNNDQHIREEFIEDLDPAEESDFYESEDYNAEENY